MNRCDPSQTSVLVTEIRSIAESVRAYGATGAARGLVAATPVGLHVIATHIESEMRSWAHIDEVLTGSFAVTADHPGPTLRTIEFPDLRTVPTLVAPQALSPEVQIAELRTEAARLAVVRQGLPAALDTSATAHYVNLLTKRVRDILAFAEAVA